MAFAGHRDLLYDAELSPDGSLVATAGYDRTILLWDTATWQPRGVLEGHAGTVYSVRFSPDGERLVSASQDGSARRPFLPGPVLERMP